MIYLFKRGIENKSAIYVSQVKSSPELKKEMQQSSNILFVYDESENSIEVVNEYYEVIECTYFIFKHLGIFKQISDLNIKYLSKDRNCM